MGKGDKRTARGKRFKASFGKSRSTVKNKRKRAKRLKAKKS